MGSTRTVLQESVRLVGRPVPGAEDRQQRIEGFDQAQFSRSHVLCIGAGGLISHIAPTLVRKGIGALTVLDDDEVEVSNLNRQRFYPEDVGKNKALALAANLQRECIHATRLTGHAWRLEEAIDHGIDLSCDVAVCGVDNTPTRVLASQYCRQTSIPIIFTAVSANADHGYVFVQDTQGACFGCVFPDAIDDATYPCPGTPAITDILQVLGGIVVYAIDTCLMSRPRQWNYRSVRLADGAWDASQLVKSRSGCRLCPASHVESPHEPALTRGGPPTHQPSFDSSHDECDGGSPEKEERQKERSRLQGQPDHESKLGQDRHATGEPAQGPSPVADAHG